MMFPCPSVDRLDDAIVSWSPTVCRKNTTFPKPPPLVVMFDEMMFIDKPVALERKKKFEPPPLSTTNRERLTFTIALVTPVAKSTLCKLSAERVAFENEITVKAPGGMN